MIGKGPRSDEYRELLKQYHAVYLSAIGGAAAALVSFVTYKIVQAKKARKQALASTVPPAHVQTVNIR